MKNTKWGTVGEQGRAAAKGSIVQHHTSSREVLDMAETMLQAGESESKVAEILTRTLGISPVRAQNTVSELRLMVYA